MIIKWLVRDSLRDIQSKVRMFAKMDADVKSDYAARCRDLAKDGILINEMAKLGNEAKDALQRKTKVDEEVAFYRGMLYFQERLNKRLSSPLPKAHLK